MPKTPTTQASGPPPGAHDPHHGHRQGSCRPGGGPSPTGPATTASASPGFRTHRQRYHATVVEEQGGARRCSRPLPRPRPPALPGTTGPGRGATSSASARSATPRTSVTPGMRRGGVRVRGGPGRPAGPCQPYQRQGSELGLQRRVHHPGRRVGRLPELATGSSRPSSPSADLQAPSASNARPSYVVVDQQPVPQLTAAPGTWHDGMFEVWGTDGQV